MGRAVVNRRDNYFKKLRVAWVFILSTIFCTLSFAQSALPSRVSTCSGVAINFVPSGAISGTTYFWTLPMYSSAEISGGTAQLVPQFSITQTLILDSNATASSTATYDVFPSQGAPFQLIVTVNPLPVLSSNTTQVAICSGSPYTYQPTSATPGTSITWSRALVTGISNNGTTGQGAINEVLNNITVNPVDVDYVFALNANGCRSDQMISVTINPTPFLTTTLTPTSICSGQKFNYSPQSIFPNTNFAWARSTNGGINNGSTTSGSNDPNEQLVNNTLFAQLATYTYTMRDNATACVGTQVVRVVVNPVPTVTSQNNVPACSDNNFIVSPTTVPFGTLYNWSVPTITAGSVSGASAASNQLYIGQALTNNGSSNATIVYTVTPNSFGCKGADFNVTVNLSPPSAKTVLTSSLTPPDICSRSFFSYQPMSAATASYTWERFLENGISTAPNKGSNNPNELLTNSSTVPIAVHYAFTITANGCSNTQDVTVIVNPDPVLSSSQTPPAVCSNALFSYAPTSATPNTSFNWTRPAVSGISNTSGGGAGNPAETLVNTTNLPINVTYVYSLLTVNGCTNTQNVVVPVYPSPAFTSTVNPPAICSGSKFNYTPSSSTAGSVFTWSRTVTPSISNGPGAGTGDPSEFLINSGIAAVPVPYTFRATASGCSTDKIVTVVVNPTPNIIDQTVTACSNTAFIMGTVTVPPNTLYTWPAPVINPVGSVAGSSAQFTQTGVSQLLTNQTLDPATVTYTVTPTAGTCSGSGFKIVVTVNPTPVIPDQSVASVCSGTPFNHSPSNVPIGTTYTWSSPVEAPLNSLFGASAQPINQSNISQTLSSLNNVVDTATYTVTPAAYGCIGNAFKLVVSVNPVAAINNLSDTICSTATFFSTPAPVPANTTYTWGTPVSVPFGSVVGGSAGVLPVSTISQTLVNSTNATGQLVYTVQPVSGNCPAPSFTLTITVGVPLPFTANQSALICSGTSFDATPVTSRAGTTYTWGIPAVTPPGSVVGISAASTQQATVSQTLTNLTNVTDTVVYTVLPYSTGCRGNLFTATVRVIALPKATITGNAVVCRYPVDTLNVSFTGMGPWNFSYLNDNVSGTQTGITASPYQWVVPAIPGTGVSTRKLQITNVKDLACFNSVDTAVFVQRVNPLPVGVVNSIHGAYICNNILDTLFVSNLSATDLLSYQWTFNGAPIAGATGDSIATLQAGKYNARLTNQYGCVDTAGTSVTLSYIMQPVLKFRYDTYCINTPAQFTNLTDTSNLGLTQWTWDFGDTTSAATFHSVHTYLRGGDHHLRLTASQSYCPAYATSIDSTITVQYPIPGILMPSVSAYQTELTPLSVRRLPGYRYRWNPSRGIDLPDSASVNFNLSATQQYYINLISPGGCITTDSLLVRVFDRNLVDIMVPKSFTPNGDGINDILYPYIAGIKTFKYFRIFNRYNQLMFETTNPDRGWNGSMNGTPQPMSIYIWIAVGTANDGSLVEKRGQTLLLR
ncbi:MAG: PKD-like domain-containing protein [Bacteroidota bacterium]